MMEYINYITYFIIACLLLIIFIMYKFKNSNTFDNKNIVKLIDKINNNDKKIEKLLAYNIKYIKSNNLKFPKVDTINKRSLFNKDYIKVNILIDTNCIIKNKTFNHGNYIYDFNNNESLNPRLNAMGEMKNIIGFKLIKAIMPSRVYTITNDINDRFIYQIKDLKADKIYTIIVKLKPGNYSMIDLDDSFPESYNPESYTIIDDTSTDKNIFIIKNNIDNSSEIIHKLTFNTPEINHKIKFFNNIEKNLKLTNKMKNILKLTYKTLGIIDDDNQFNISKQTTTIPNFVLNYVDLVIDEIPRIACKNDSSNRKIIDRIPILSNGENMIYIPENTNNDNFFTPITLDKLSIKIYDSSGFNYYNSENADHFFEFELTQLIDDNFVGLIGPN